MISGIRENQLVDLIKLKLFAVHTALKGYKKSKFHFLFLASEWTLDHKNKV